MRFLRSGAEYKFFNRKMKRFIAPQDLFTHIGITEGSGEETHTHLPILKLSSGKISSSFLSQS